jgi:multicomponent Na+:H+ antiporter subunit G
MWRLILVSPLLLAGFFFLAVGTIGLVRLPDIYTRMHATGKCDTLGAGLTLLALVILAPNLQTALKIALVDALILVINPVTAHVVANSAYRYGAHEMPGTKVLDLRGGDGPAISPPAGDSGRNGGERP